MILVPTRVRKGLLIFIGAQLLATRLVAQKASVADAPQTQPAAPQPAGVQFDMPKSRHPLHAYAPDTVPEPVLTNSLGWINLSATENSTFL